MDAPKIFEFYFLNVLVMIWFLSYSYRIYLSHKELRFFFISVFFWLHLKAKVVEKIGM